MKIWNTKYVLTQGILEQDASDCGDGMVCVSKEGELSLFLHGDGKEWHRTREDAVKRAEEKRKAQIEFLKKQIAKLEALKFYG